VWRTADVRVGPYLVILQDKTETSGDRLKRAEGIGGVSHAAEEQFGRSGRSRLPVRFVLVRSSARPNTLVGMKNFWCRIRDGRGTCVV